MDKSSLYASTKSRNGFLLFYNPVDIPIEDDTNMYITVTSEYAFRPGKLAYDLYGDEKLLWVFRYFNNDKIEDMIFDMKAGMTILVPTKDRLLNYV